MLWKKILYITLLMVSEKIPPTIVMYVSVVQRIKNWRGRTSSPLPSNQELPLLSLCSTASFRLLIKPRTLILASACKWDFYLDVCSIAYVGVHIDGKYLKGQGLPLHVPVSLLHYVSKKNVQVDANLCFLSKG